MFTLHLIDHSCPFGLTRPLYQFDSYKPLYSSEGRFDLLIYKSRSDRYISTALISPIFQFHIYHSTVLRQSCNLFFSKTQHGHLFFVWHVATKISKVTKTVPVLPSHHTLDKIRSPRVFNSTYDSSRNIS